MKIVSSLAFAAFLATTEAFGPAQPLKGVVSNGAANGMTMRYGIKDQALRGRVCAIVDANPTKEIVEEELLSDSMSEAIKGANWKLRKALIRKVTNQAARYDVAVDPAFGKADTQAEREAKEAVAGAANKAAKVAAIKAAADEFAANQAARKERRAAHKARAAEALAARKSGAPAPAAEEAAAPAPAPAAEEAAAPAPAAGGEITPKTIKALRDLTGAGMMDCKKALTESGGDQEAAAEFLRKKGLAQADKKATRVAAEGKIAVSTGSDGKAVMVEVNCETDFVGKDSTFLAYCDRVAGAASASGTVVVDDLMNEEVDGESLEATRQALVSKIGENIQVRRLESRGDGSTTVGGYVHMGTIGVLVEIEGGSEQLCTDIAMHVAAMNPPFATADDVPQEVLDNEKRILTEQAIESGKPEAIVEKMVEGRIRKFLEEKCLVSQNYVKDSDLTVQQLLDKNDAKMIGFSRLVVGEGIEKKVDDFAAEVASMAAGN